LCSVSSLVTLSSALPNCGALITICYSKTPKPLEESYNITPILEGALGPSNNAPILEETFKSSNIAPILEGALKSSNSAPILEGALRSIEPFKSLFDKLASVSVSEPLPSDVFS
jgi:hypothetical protein